MHKIPIGGYFSLELPQHEEYHRDSIKLNTGRNCLEYILRAYGYRKVYIPYYTCEVVLEPINKLDLAYEFYHININFELEEDIVLREDEALLYTNYYGLKQEYVKKLAKRYSKHLIIDNTQAFYDMPVEGISTFYTCRKFFGVPDGAYLYCDKELNDAFEQDVSYNHTTFLTKRIDLGAEAGFADYRKQDDGMVGLPIHRMSKFTERMMQSIDYRRASDIRRANYEYLDKRLKETNLMSIQLPSDSVPMVYPFMAKKSGLRQHLIENKVFVAKYWPNVNEWADKDSIEYNIANNMVPLPIDQRYGVEEMKYIINQIQKYDGE